MKKKFLLAALSLGTAMTVSGCGDTDTNTADQAANTAAKQEITVAFDAEPETLDPSKAQTEGSFLTLNLFNEGLYRLDSNGAAQPGVAESMPEISSDGKTYTIHLRADAKWSDASPVTAHDFEYSWKRTLNPQTKSEYAFMLNNWIVGASDYNNGRVANADGVGVKALDDRTLQIQLINPIPFFTKQLAFQVFFPEKQEFVEKMGDQFGSDADKVLTNGPYTLKQWVHEQSLEFVKNDQYWDAKTVKLEKVTAQILQDQNTGVNLYETGGVDVVAISGEQVKQWQGKPDLVNVPKRFSYYLMFNQQKDPAFKNANIRKALTMAIDRQAFVDLVLGNGSKPATGLVPPPTEDGNDQQFRKTAGDTEPAFNPDEAKKLLAQGLKEVGLEKLPAFTMIADNDDIAKKSLEFIQAAFKQNLGVETEIQPMVKKARTQKQNQMDYDVIAPSRWGADYNDPMTFLDMWVTGSSFNKVGYSNPQYDALIKAATTETDAAKRAQQLVEAEKILMNDMPIGPLYFETRSFLNRPDVHNVVVPGQMLEFKWAYRR